MTTKTMANQHGGGHLHGANCACRKSGKKTATVSSEAAQLVTQLVAETVARVTEEAQQAGVLKEVEAELAKHPDCVAIVNGQGVVRTFLQPKNPYLATAAGPHSVSPHEQQMRSRVSELAVKIAQREASGAGADEITRLKLELDAAKRVLEEMESRRDRVRKREKVGGEDVFTA
jgi:hypothetical protein